MANQLPYDSSSVEKVKEEAAEGQDSPRSSNLGSEGRTIDDGSLDLEKDMRNKEKPWKRYGIFPGLPSNDPGPPPDGGTTAWLQVLAGHLMTFITAGLLMSFGVFQPYYEETLGMDSSAVSWIGTSQLFLLMGIGIFSGRATDAGLVHEAVFVGTFLIVCGLFMTSLSTQYYQLLLSQGICVGLGMGILYIPGFSVPASYFKNKKAIALAIVNSGTGTGGIVFPVMVQKLLPRIGFGWTLRCMGLVTLIIAVGINLLLRMRIPPRKSGPLADWRSFTDITYVFFVIGFFLISWVVFFALYYVDKYGHMFAGLTLIDSINLLLASNGLGILGRLSTGFIASRWCGPLNTAIPSVILAAIILYCWIGVGDSRSGIYVFAAIYGFLSNAIQSLMVLSLAALTDDLSMLGTRIGMAFSLGAIASLTGGPVGGALIQADGGSYLGAQIWGGTVMLLGATAWIVARVWRTGFVLQTKI